MPKNVKKALLCLLLYKWYAKTLVKMFLVRKVQKLKIKNDKKG